MRMTPKSGSPVFGHIDVNSGQSIAISNSRSGRGFGKVSIVGVDMPRVYGKSERGCASLVAVLFWPRSAGRENLTHLVESWRVKFSRSVRRGRLTDRSWRG